jgi:glycosyltransferase involved in cell wall biosynthesis
MRIVLVNWARIWDGAAFGGGVNQYCQALALELVRNGHDVVSLFGGTTFVPHPAGCFIRRNDDWMGLRVFEVVNSPVMAPSIVQFQRPLGEVSAPELEAQVGRLFQWLQPDAVHWNNIEGFSIGCVAAAKRATGGKARNIFSLHNYHTVCPQVYLLQGHRVLCTSYDNGHNCDGCIPTKDPDQTRREMIAAHEKAIGGKDLEKAEWEFRDALNWPRRGFRWWREARRLRAVVQAGKLPGHACESADEALRPLPPADKDERGRTPQLMAELNPPKPPDPNSPERRIVLNVIQPEPPSDKPLNDYGRRRQAMVKMLSGGERGEGCDRTLAVSNFVRHKFVSLGVDPKTIRTLPIGSRINRVIALKPDLIFDPPAFEPRPTPWQKQRPVRLHFMGYNNHYKGLPILADVLETMSPEHLRQIKLSIFALDGQYIEWLFRRLEPRLAGGVGGLQFATGYNFHDIPWMMGGKDICLVPSVWWDNAPQTVFESLACGVPVLGAAVGGIPDFVVDRHNGLLFRANDRDDLRRCLIEIVENPHLLEDLRRNVRPCKSIEDHAREMELVYKGDDEQIYDASYSPWNTQGKLFENPKVDVVTPSREPVRS